MNIKIATSMLILACFLTSAILWSCDSDSGKTLLIPMGGGSGSTEEIDMAVVSYTEPGACTTYHSGELWYDSTAMTLKICDDNAWKPAVGNPTALVGATEPFACSSSYIGALWYDTADGVLNICLASGWAHASTEAGDSLTPCTNCIIFATSTTYNGNLGGLEGADEICNLRAAAGGLPGYYKALLSTGTIHGRDHTRIRPDASFITTDSSSIASSYTDLWDGTIAHQIRDEFGASGPSSTYTGTESNGYSSSSNCSGWTTTSGSVYYGAPSSTTSSWVRGSTFFNCEQARGIYCVQWSEE
ncbi:MAG: DUF1554 domain-containing protein [Spirochaetes bacterium]|nr:DUF1554 domain-containing protein [Spirochaetota bacterium]